MKSGFLPSPQVLVVEASAGSGKTYSLVRRYVQVALYLAAHPETITPIQSILAITFTNKATREMKSRILGLLKRIALQQLESFEAQDILRPLGLDEQRASTLAFRVMDDVIRQYHYFQVQTIDSFINALLAGCSFKIGLSARFKIQRNAMEYLQLALDEMLLQAQSHEKLRRMFTDFAQQYLFLENRSGWFPADDLLKVMGVLFGRYNTYQKPLVPWPQGDDVFARKKQVYRLMQQLRPLCPLQTDKRFLNHLDDFLETHDGIFNIDDLKSYWNRKEFCINKGGEVSSQLRDLWQQLHTAIHDLCLLEARSMFNAYITLFNDLLKGFYRLSRRDDVLFLEELNRRAACLFEDGLVSVEELYVRLSARFRHYLIDEFQDTSLSQWRNLSLLVQEGLASGGSLFYVGDKKQAIYSFRGGESRLFDALQIQLADFNVQTQTLTSNYRSCPNIIAFNNKVFSQDNLRDFLDRRLEDATERRRTAGVHFSDEDFEQIANTFGHSHQTPHAKLVGGIVRVSHLQGHTKPERMQEVREKIIPLVRELEQRFNLKDIAVLARGNEEVEAVTQWLLQEGIDAQSERNSDLKNNPLVQELMALLAFLHSPVDNGAFAQFCLGDLMPAATGLDRRTLQDFLFDCGRQARQTTEIYFYKRFREAFPDIWEDFFEESFRQAGVHPLYELAVGLMARLECERHFPGSQAFCMHWLELIKKYETQSCDWSSFLEYYSNLEGEERFVPMAEAEAVRVLTVHKAKGLEFAVVIVPFLEMDIKAGAGGRDGTQAYLLDIREEGMGLVRLKESYRQFCPELQELYEREYKKSFLGELNSVYVALTRAVEELHVFVPEKTGNSVNPAKFLIPSESFCLGEPGQRPNERRSAETFRRNMRPLVSGAWLGRLQEEFLVQAPVSAVKARQGDFYHAMLMAIGRVDQGSLDSVLQQAWQQACARLTPPGLGPEILADVKSLINSPETRKFFYLSETVQIFCEKEFVNRFGDTRRVDRLIVLKDEIWIVDYKLSGAAAEAHQKQLQEYISLVQQFYPRHKVTGHIVIL